MSFEIEMDQFFVRNCYSEKERLRVKAWPPYQLAAENNDVVQGQETAARVLEGAERLRIAECGMRNEAGK